MVSVTKVLRNIKIVPRAEMLLNTKTKNRTTMKHYIKNVKSEHFYTAALNFIH